MAAAMLVEEELQNSMATSEEDAEFEEDNELAADMVGDNADAYAANNQLHNGMVAAQSDSDEDEEEGDEEDLTDEDVEGEEDDMADQGPNMEEDESGEEDEDGDEDGEGVGAVKIQPGLLEDDEDAVSGSDEEESAVSADDDDESKDSTDAEVEVEWEPTVEEEEEPANPNRCMYDSHRD